jgi:hypothetical protein
MQQQKRNTKSSHNNYPISLITNLATTYDKSRDRKRRTTSTISSQDEGEQDQSHEEGGGRGSLC